ncbi:Transcription factor of the Forkhead/HNF3 family, partial [Pseudoloma neurophilia]
MKKYDERVDKIESEALDGILLLKGDQISQKTLLASLNGRNEQNWVYDVFDQKFRIRDGQNSVIIYYFSVEKTWFIFLEQGNVKIDTHQLKSVKILRNNTLIEVGNIFCVFVIKSIVRKEYRKLLVDIILDTDNKRLSLSDIYEKLLNEYDFSLEKKQSWKNSIRCVLSESTIFFKIPKETNHGRGSYWSVDKKELEKMDNETIKRCEKKLPVDFFIDKKCKILYMDILDPEYSDLSSEEFEEVEKFVPQKYNFGNPKLFTEKRDVPDRTAQDFYRNDVKIRENLISHEKYSEDRQYYMTSLGPGHSFNTGESKNDRFYSEDQKRRADSFDISESKNDRFYSEDQKRHADSFDISDKKRDMSTKESRFYSEDQKRRADSFDISESKND